MTLKASLLATKDCLSKAEICVKIHNNSKSLDSEIFYFELKRLELDNWIITKKPWLKNRKISWNSTWRSTFFISTCLIWKIPSSFYPSFLDDVFQNRCQVIFSTNWVIWIFHWAWFQQVSLLANVIGRNAISDVFAWWNNRSWDKKYFWFSE